MRFSQRLLYAALCVAFLVGCTDDHGHEHAPDGSHVEHAAHTDASEEDHSDGAHGHAPGAIAITLWTERTELFMEYPVLIIDEEAEFLAHLTDLRDFSPVIEGKLVCTFKKPDGTTVRVTAERPSRPGIFIPVVTFSEPGVYAMELRLVGPQVEDLIHVADVQVYRSASEAPHEQDSEESIHIGQVKTGCWFVQEIGRVSRLDPGQLGRQLHPLGFATGEGRGTLPEAQVPQSDAAKGIQDPMDPFLVFE